MECVTLRQWRDYDLDRFAAMNSDPAVMRYFPAGGSREESAEMMEQQVWLVAVAGAILRVDLRAPFPPRF
jgi:hypothetical protein